MTETKTTYTAGTVTFVADPTPEEILAEYLEFTPVGIRIRPGVDPNTIPHEVFDTAWQRVNTNLDRDRWQIADLSIMHERRFDKGDSFRAMASVGLYRSISTAETWANIARNVPYDVRVPAQLEDGANTRMSIYWHKHVAMLPIEVQCELLQVCLVNNLSRNERWTEDRFGEVCQAWREEHSYKPPQQRRPVNRPARDIIFETTMDLGTAEAKVEASRVETSQLARQLSKAEAGLWGVIKILADCSKSA